MIQLRNLLPLAALIVLARLNIFEYADPSNGKTGAPGEGNCTECHAPANPNFSGSLTLTGIPSQVRIGQTYTLTLRTNKTRGNAITAGLQLVALNQNNLNAGILSNPTNVGGVLTFNNRTYLEHKLEPASFGKDSSVSWTVDWTPGNLAENDIVTFYANSLISDGNRNVTGDLQVHRRLVTIVTSGPPPLVVDATLKQITCQGDNNAGITLNVSGGTPPYNYAWSANTPDSLTNMQPGTYTVTVTSQDTQRIVRSFSLTDPPVLNFSLASSTNINCNGIANGQAILQATGGMPPYLVAWPDGGSGFSRSDLSIGKYVVTVSDIRGCLKTAQFEISSAININPRPGAVNETAPNKNDGIAFVNPTGGTPPYLVLWENGIIGDTIKNLGPGQYTVIIADQTGCLVSDTIEILQGTCPLDIQSSLTQPTCAGEKSGSVILTPLNPASRISFEWSNGTDSCCLTAVGPGTYRVNALDTIGCSFQDTFSLVSPPNLELLIVSQKTATCDTASDGALTVGVIGGFAPYSLVWSNGVLNDTLQNVKAGNYQLLVTDSNYCTIQAAFEITAKDVESPQLINNFITLDLNQKGLAELTLTQLDSILIDNCSETIVASLRDSFYCGDIGSLRLPIQAADISGNLLSDTLNLLVQDKISPGYNLVGSTEFSQCSGFDYPIIIPTDNCAVQSVTRIDGIGPAGIFPFGKTTEKYLILDGAGNSTELSFDIIIEDPLPVQLNVQQPRCSVDSSGSITIIPLKDSLLYSLIWNDGFTGFTRTALPSSIYLVTINDSTGCSKLLDIELEPREITLNVDSISHPEKDKSDGFIQLTAQGQVSPFKIIWSRNGTPFAETFDFLRLNNLSAGTYRAELIDAEGCKKVTDSIQLGATSAVNPLIIQAGFSQYPNPVNGYLSWTLYSGITVERVDIYSVQGQLMYSERPITNRNISVQHLPPGSYFCQWHSTIGNFISKLIKL